MLRAWFNFLSLFLFIFLASNEAFAEYEKPIKWSGNLYKIINDYNKVQKRFFQQVCSPSDDGKYNKLIKQYRGQGFYLPKDGDNIDRNAIIKNLHFFRKKIKFISSTLENLKKNTEELL